MDQRINMAPVDPKYMAQLTRFSVGGFALLSRYDLTRKAGRMNVVYQESQTQTESVYLIARMHEVC